MPMRDATELLQSIAHDHLLTAAERAAGMLALVSIPGTVLFNADDTKAWQALLGGYARPIFSPPHHPTQRSERRASASASIGQAGRPRQTTNPSAATAARTHRRSGYDARRHRPTR